METQKEQPSKIIDENRQLSQLPFGNVLGAGFLAVLFFGALAITAVYIFPLENPESQVAAAATVYNPYENMTLAATSAIVIDLTNGKTLYSLNPDTQLPLASLTKIALVLAVSEVLPPDDILLAKRDITSAGGAQILPAGELWRVQDIIDAVLVTSSNNGAERLAEAANGFLHERFPEVPDDNVTLWRMNALAQDLGLKQTYFLSVNGLDVSETLASAYGSARDMATLFTHAFETKSAVFSGTAREESLFTSVNGAQGSVARNTNELAGIIPELIMGKTGFTDLAGGNLVVIFDVGIVHPVVAVILGSTQEGRFEDMQKLVNVTRFLIATE